MATKRQQSQQTQTRLAKVLQQVGKDALQPAADVLQTTWAKSVLAASRVATIAGLKAASPGGAPGFDYGPVGLTLLQWITVNRLLRCHDAALTWERALNGIGQPEETAPPVAKKAAPDVLGAIVTGGTVTLPVNPAPTVAPSVGQAAAPVIPPVTGGSPFAPSVAEAIVVEAQEAIVVDVPPDVAATVKVPYVSPAEKAHPEWDWQPASKVFGVKGLRGKVAVWPLDETRHKDAPLPPAVDDNYVWTKEHLQWAVFSASECPAKGIWFWGNRGSGKTEFCRQFAARTGRPFYGVTFSRTMEPSEFLGDMGAIAGASVWQDGTVLQGLRCPVPAVILFDEISYGQSSHVSGPLNEIIHPACTFNVPRTGERVNFSKGHLFIAADNTNGTGDPSGMFPGANVLNRATMDRFAYFRRFTYLPKALEVRLLLNRSGCDDVTAEKVWSILDALRKKVDSGLLSDPPSTREAIAFCCALRAGFDEKDAFETCFVGKYPEESQEEMRVTFVASFNGTPTSSSDAAE